MLWPTKSANSTEWPTPIVFPQNIALIEHMFLGRHTKSCIAHAVNLEFILLYLSDSFSRTNTLTKRFYHFLQADMIYLKQVHTSPNFSQLRP